MHYLAHTQSCTSVEQAIKCDFRESGVDILVLGKETALEFHALEPTGLKLLHKETIYGQILDLKAWKQPGADTSVIAVLTAFPHLFVLSTGGTSSFLRTVSSVSLVERSGRLSDEITCLSVDTSSRCLLAHVYAGLVRVFPLGKEVKKKGRRSSTMKKEKEMGDEKFVLEEEVDLERGYNVVLPDLNVFAISLLALPSSYPPTIGLIQQDYTGQRVFKTYALDLSNKEFFADDQLLTRKSVRLEDYGSNTIISVKSSASVEDVEEKEEGVVIVGETMAVWISLLVPEGERKSEVTSTKRKRRDTFERTIGTKLPISVITAYCQVEGNSNQFVLGDLYGTFYTLNIEKSTDNREKVLSLEIENLGLTSSAKCIVYLANNYLFVGSHFSDSQLVRLPVKPSAIDAMDVDDGSGSGPVAVGNKGKGKASDKLEVIANFTNLGPIYDFRVVDVEGVGHSHVVTCSGGFGQGSLRIVRQGVGLNELASFDFESVQKCWSFRSNKAGKADHLLLSSTHDSRILAFESSEGEEAEEGSVEELESFANFKFDAPTLSVLQLDSGTVVQVLREGIVFGWQGRVDGVKGFRGGSNWKHPDGKKITVAAAEGDYLALGFEGGEIVLLRGTDPDQSKDLELIKSMDMSNELACLALSTIHGKTVLAAGLWNVHSVCLLALPDLSLLHEQAIETSFPLRSVELSTFEDSSYLLVGTGEGTLIHYQFDENNTPIANTKKQIRLGTQAITFTSFESHEGSAVFVTCDQPAIISRGVDRFNYTVVGMKNVVSVATFDNVNYPSCLAFVTSDGVRIGKFDQLEKLHPTSFSAIGLA
ncbi:hypothetical protein BT69DRAFT_1331921 [Atractiella rhizophila]|nr:hypothetical protein BT69DRAFT_1331921 [Atractiella rhizophila]